MGLESREDREVATELLAELEPGERVVWSGHPVSAFGAPRLMWRLFKACLGLTFWMLAGLYVVRLAPIVAQWGADQLPVYAIQISDAVAIAFVGLRWFFWLLAGVSGAIVVYRGLLIRRFLLRSSYALTDARCLVRTPGRDFGDGVETHSFGPNRLGDMHRADMAFGVGSLVFRRERLRKHRVSGESSSVEEELVPTGFLGIRDAKRVQKLVRDTLLGGEVSP